MRSLLLTVLMCCVFGSPAKAAIIWRIAATTQSGTVNDASITTNLAPNVSGPDGGDYAASATGLSAFDTNASGAGNFYIRHAPSSGSTALNYGTGYTEFTIAADPGYLLNLDSLSFLSGRGATTGTRGFEIYGAVDGVPTISDKLLDVNAETGTRNSPVLRTINLSDSQYQGIDSITFRYYALTDRSDRTIEFSYMALNGSVEAVPEPASIAFIGLAGVITVVQRRRKRTAS